MKQVDHSSLELDGTIICGSCGQTQTENRLFICQMECTKAMSLWFNIIQLFTCALNY